MDCTPAAFNPKTRYNIGVMVGRLTKSLRNFYHPYAGRNVHLRDMPTRISLPPLHVRRQQSTLTPAISAILSRIMEDAYHGITETTMRLSPEILEPPDNVECLQVPDMYRGPFANDPDAAKKYAADADRAIADLARRGYKPAVFLVDTALCSNGVLMKQECVLVSEAGPKNVLKIRPNFSWEHTFLTPNKG